MKELLASLLPALLLTVAAESVLIVLFTHSPHWLLLSILGNIATNPLLNLLLAPVRRAAEGTVLFTAVMLALEVLAVLYEALLYREGTETPWKRCFCISAAANLCSFLLGCVLL